MSADLKKFLANNLPEFLLLVAEPRVVFAAGDAVRSLRSVVVCYDAQHFYKNLVKNGGDPIATGKGSVDLAEFVAYCESKIPRRFADDVRDHSCPCPMTVSDLMRVDAWAHLYAIVGPRLMRILLFECMLFVPLPGGAYYCVNAPATAASHQVIRSFGTLAWSRKRRNGDRKTDGGPPSPQLRCFNIAELLKDVKPLMRVANADEMFREILKDDETHLDGLKRKLRVIATKHSLPALRNIFADTVGDHGDRAEVPLGRVKKFAAEVVRKTVPRELFGPAGNRDQYCRNLCRVLDSGKRHDFTVQHLTHKIKVKRVGWLSTVPADRRPAMMARTLVWLTNAFVFRRIAHFFRIVSTDKPSNGIAYFAKSGWAAAYHEKISPLTAADGGGWFCGQLEAGVKYRRWQICPYAKPGGRVRLIFKQRLPETGNEKRLTDQCLTFLRCLSRGAYPPDCRSVSRKQFFRMWQEQQLGDERASSGVLYYVRTDFRDAFASFEQDKLLSVVRDRIVERFGKKTQWLRLHTVDVIRVGKSSCVFRKKRTFFDGLPAPEFPADSLVFHDRTDAVSLSRVWTAVRRRVLCNAVDRGGRLWAMTRGVVQGDRLSVALCDLLLADLQATRLAGFCAAAGRLYRFVDDYVFVSPDRSEARRFLSTMLAGFDEYGLRLNRSKTVTNVFDDGGGTGCSFLGFRLDAATGAVTRDEGAYRGRRPLHFFDYGLGRDGRPGLTLYAKITRPGQHPVPAALVSGALNPTGTAVRNLASVAAYKAFTVAASMRHYYFHLNPDHVLRIVHAVARLMYRKLCAQIRRASAVTPMQCKWIVYEVYARVLGARLSGGDGRVMWIVDQLRDRQAAVARRCETRDLKDALRRGGGYNYTKMFD